jgi:hypothetical protein
VAKILHLVVKELHEHRFILDMIKLGMIKRLIQVQMGLVTRWLEHPLP